MIALFTSFEDGALCPSSSSQACALEIRFRLGFGLNLKFQLSAELTSSMILIM